MDFRRFLRKGTCETARAVDRKKSNTDSRRILRGVAGTGRTAEEQQSAVDSRRVLSEVTMIQVRGDTAAEVVETNAGHLKKNTDKRIRMQRHLTTMSTLGGMLNAAIELGVQSVDVELDPEAYMPVDIRALARSRKQSKSMRAERGALDNQGCCETVKIPLGVTLIRSRYVYKLKKDQTGNVAKQKSRLVISGCNQVEGLDFGETFAPVAKATTFPLILDLPRC